jgi:hypothetical protein
MVSSNVFKDISSLNASFGAESSYYFLSLYQYHYNWNVYDSDVLGVDIVDKLTTLFTTLHAKVNISSQENSLLSMWSADPLGVFRYRMNSSNYWQEIGYLHKIVGYIVEGAYWNNGFFYRVVGKDVIQIKLYIDDATMIGYSYPEATKISDR